MCGDFLEFFLQVRFYVKSLGELCVSKIAILTVLEALNFDFW